MIHFSQHSLLYNDSLILSASFSQHGVCGMVLGLLPLVEGFILVVVDPAGLLVMWFAPLASDDPEQPAGRCPPHVPLQSRHRRTHQRPTDSVCASVCVLINNIEFVFTTPGGQEMRYRQELRRPIL